MSEKTINVNNLKVNYKTFGEKGKEVFLILHGWGGSSDSWVEVAKLLSKKFFVIVPDLPGFGKTPLDKVYTISDYSNFVKDFLKKLNIDDIILLGHSNGGAISICLVGKIKIKKLILNNSAGIRKKTKTSLKRKIFGFFVKPLKFLRNLPGGEKLRIIFYKLIDSRDYLDAEKNPFKRQTFLNMINTDLQEQIQNINIPTLLIRGKHDTYTPLEDGKKMHKLIKNSELKIIDSTHGIHLKKPKELVDVILNLI